MRHSQEIKQQAVELYRYSKNTHKVGHKLGIHPGTVYHWVRKIIPENQRQKNKRMQANNRAISIFKKLGPLTYKEATRFFSDDLQKRLVEDGVLKKISRKYGKFTYSIYFLAGQEKLANERLEKIISQLANFRHQSPVMEYQYTKQEESIATMLRKCSIPFQHSKSLGKINLCPDFCIPDSKKPKIIIEAKNTKTKVRGNYTYISKVMGYDAFVIKKNYPNAILIAVINGLWTPSGERRLKEAFDCIIDEENIPQLINIVQKHLSG